MRSSNWTSQKLAKVFEKVIVAIVEHQRAKEPASNVAIEMTTGATSKTESKTLPFRVAITRVQTATYFRGWTGATPQESIEIAAILDAIRIAAASGQWVDVEG